MNHLANARSLFFTGFVAAATVAIGAIGAACGGSEPAAQSPANPTPSASATTADTAAATPPVGDGAPKAWKDMDHGARLAFMSQSVLPKMKGEFKDWDPKFAAMSCATCHGDGAKDGSFKMPNPKLPVLPSTPDGFKKLAETKGDAMKFMGGHVVPDMAALLGEQPFDMKTHQGFGCAECHVMEK